MVYANDFWGNTDSDILNSAIRGRDSDGIVIIGPRESDVESDRKWWSLDTERCVNRI